MSTIHYLNKLELADRLGTTKRGVEEMMRRRKIPFIKLGHRTVRFDWSAVERAVGRCNAMTTQELLGNPGAERIATDEHSGIIKDGKAAASQSCGPCPISAPPDASAAGGAEWGRDAGLVYNTYLNRERKLKASVSTIKKGIHKGEEILPYDLRAVDKVHEWTPERESELRKELYAGFESHRRTQERKLVKEIGARPHLRKQESDHEATQEKVANTCKVKLYNDGMGLRVERRLDGYSWQGQQKQRFELSGSMAYTDGNGVEHEDNRSLVPIGGGKRGKCKGATVSVMARCGVSTGCREVRAAWR